MNGPVDRKIVPPPPRRPRLADVAQPPQAAPDNLSQPSDEGYQSFVDFNFKVTAKFRKRFKHEAVLRGMTGKELLEACFKAYLEANGGDLERPAAHLLE